MIHKRLHDLWFAATGMTQAQLTQIAVRLHHSFVLAIAEPQATACPLSTESPMRAKSGKPLVTAYQNHWISSNPLTGVKLHTFCLNNMFSCCRTVLIVIPQSKLKYKNGGAFFPMFRLYKPVSFVQNVVSTSRGEWVRFRAVEKTQICWDIGCVNILISSNFRSTILSS